MESLKYSLDNESDKRHQHQEEVDELVAELTTTKTEKKQLSTELEMVIEEKNVVSNALMKLQK